MTSQPRLAGDASKLSPIDGKRTFTIDVLTTDMKTQAVTSATTQPSFVWNLRSRWIRVRCCNAGATH